MFTGSIRFFPWLLRVIAALIMLQSLFFKFSADPEFGVAFATQCYRSSGAK
jgi:hypothetical protein